jgi:hypothetical protein
MRPFSNIRNPFWLFRKIIRERPIIFHPHPSLLRRDFPVDFAFPSCYT